MLLRVLLAAGTLVAESSGQLRGQEKALEPHTSAQGERVHDFLGLGRTPDAAAAARGEKLFSSNCAFCHGAKATGGDTGPDLVRSSLVLHDEDGELIGPVVHAGRVSKGMPSFASLSEEQVHDVAEFLHLRVELTANRGTYQLQNVITGDARKGEAYFRGVGGCATCHSAGGDLAHIGSKLTPADLQQTFLYPASRTPEKGATAAPHVTVTFESGQTLSGTLKHLDDFNVSLYDSQGAYHSIAIRPGVRVQVEDKLAAHRELLDRYTDAEMHDVTAYLFTLK